jgi:small-conductance mechanosensitive channel
MPAADMPSLLQLLESPWVQGPLAFVAWVAVLLLVRRILLGGMRRVASRTAWNWDDILVQALSPTLLIVILGSGLVLLDRILPLSSEWDRAFDVTLAASMALAIIVFVDGLCRGTLDHATPSSPTLLGARGLILGGARVVVVSLGGLVFLDSIGISITPLLASLGVGSLAVALALQDTLTNLFAGVYMILDRPIEAGHLIQLESGEQGTVLRVGWRSTRIRTLPNNIVVVPNAKLGGSLIYNYSLDDPQVSIYVEVGVHYDSDLEKVERVTLEVARELMRTHEAGVPEFEPLVRFHAFADSSINFTAVLRAREFRVTYPLRSAFIKRLQARFRDEGIIIPFPIRTLDLPRRHLDGLRESLAAIGGSGPDAPAAGRSTPAGRAPAAPPARPEQRR